MGVIYEAYDKFEYTYVGLGMSPQRSVDILNEKGKEGWELIKLFNPVMGGDIYKGLMKRKITVTKYE